MFGWTWKRPGCLGGEQSYVRQAFFWVEMPGERLVSRAAAVFQGWGSSALFFPTSSFCDTPVWWSEVCHVTKTADWAGWRHRRHIGRLRMEWQRSGSFWLFREQLDQLCRFCSYTLQIAFSMQMLYNENGS